MTKTTCLILGSVLALQIPALMKSGLEQTDLASEEQQQEELPLFHEAQSKELKAASGAETVRPVSPVSVARYIHKQTRELLPIPFRGRSRQIASAIIKTANKYQMDPLFLMAVIKQESRFNPSARGSHGEIGLMQLKPTTALALRSLASDSCSGKQLSNEEAFAQVSQDLADPVKNIQMGAKYLSNLRASFKRKSHLYIAAYNMGAKGVRNHIASGVEPRIYSDQVLARYNSFAEGANEMNVARLDVQVFGRTLDL